MAQLRGRKEYNSKFIDALRQLQIDASKGRIQLVKLSQLTPGMTIESDLHSKTGLLLLAKGQEVTESAIARLNSFASLFGVAEPIRVVLPGPHEDIRGQEELANFSDALAGVASRLSIPTPSA